MNNAEVATPTHGGESKKESSTQDHGFHITMAQYQQLMNLLSKSSGPGGASSETTLTRANLTHSNPNQIHNSDFGSHFVFSIPTTHTPNNLSSHTVPWIIDSEAIDYISCTPLSQLYLDIFHELLIK